MAKSSPIFTKKFITILRSYRFEHVNLEFIYILVSQIFAKDIKYCFVSIVYTLYKTTEICFNINTEKSIRKKF